MLTGKRISYDYEDTPKPVSAVPVKILDFTSEGIVFFDGSRESYGIRLHPYGRKFNQWTKASERKFTVIVVDK